ncbi:MAG: pilus assembly protein TadG-related protein, partial [Anaerolineales bacterium]
MLHKKSEKGQALVLIAFAAVGLFAFTALSVDGGRVFSDRRHAQNAADTAALAAALARVRAQTDPDGAAKLSGGARAESNGYANDTDSTVEVKICDDPSLDLNIDCQGLPGNAVLSDYIQVKITSI